MVTYLLKKSYQHKTLKEINFNDLWGDNGVFTTMWIFGKPPKILFFKDHIKNLIKSLKAYKLNRPNIKKDSGWNWNPYIFSLLFSIVIATFEISHLIVISKFFASKGSFSLRE